MRRNEEDQTMRKTWVAVMVLVLAVVAVGCRSASTGTPDEVDPAVIEASIRTQILGAYPDETFDIGVDVTPSGVVTLKGDVDSAEQSARIADLARGVAGVTSVRNELKIE
jgi:osmotically-inducible protein OsmY